MQSYNIGIDTGGTYTDAVIVDPIPQTVLATAKALTTRGNLALGVNQALEKVLEALGDEVAREHIGLVSLSTTLATNALVEGQGAPVAVILIGFDDAMAERTQISNALSDVQIVRIAGGHDHSGVEQHPLDIQTLNSALDDLNGKVQAYAVAATYSVRNPAHERRVEKLIRERTGCPVTASGDLCDALNGPRRALTAAFNARIVTLIVALVSAVRSALKAHGIHAPLMIVKGDGSIANADVIVEKPIETILSGPAASVIGARCISGLSDFIIADMGGTTSDVAIVKNGWPELNAKGSLVGGYRTLVQAIDMQTIGLGGDSEIEVDYKGQISLRANRVIPVSLLASQYPQVLSTMDNALMRGTGLRHGARFIVRPQGQLHEQALSELSVEDARFLTRIGNEPRPWSEWVNRHTDHRRVQRLNERGLLQICGLTPSDAAHVLGLQSQWSLPAARSACLLMGRSSGAVSVNPAIADSELEKFASAIFDTVVAASTHLIAECLSGQTYQANDPILEPVTQGRHYSGDLEIRLTPKIPLVAVGGPSQVFYPAVGKRLNCVAQIPPGSEVANAIGAAVGMIKIRKVFEIIGLDGGGYHLHGDGDPILFMDPKAALVEGRKFAQQAAEAQSLAMGGHALHTDIQVQRINLPDVQGDHGLVSATIVAECLSTPKSTL